MSLGLKNDKSLKALQKDFVITKPFEGAYITNSVQFNTIEINHKENIAFASGIYLSNDNQVFKFNSEISVYSDEPLLRFQFSLDGMCAYKPLQHGDYSIQIPCGYCNMLYCSSVKERVVYFNRNTKIFEIYLKPTAYKTFLGKEHEAAFKKLDEAMSNGSSFILWDKSKFIPPHIRSRINDIIQCTYQGDIQKTFLESKLTVLLIDFLMGTQVSNKSSTTTKVLHTDYLALVKVEAHIRKNLKYSLKISDLAEIAGFNSTKLKRDFKKVYDITIFKYITALRMEVAKSLILQDDVTIAQAAYEVGYANPQHFTTAFKRTMGYLPRALKSRTL